MTKDITEIENVAPWIEMFIADWMKEQLKQEVDSESNLAALGVGSVHAAPFMNDLAEFVGMKEVPVRLLLEHPTAGGLARHLAMVITGRTEDMNHPTAA
jgi:hypothetical protein